MKPNIHPAYYENLKITCACGNVVIAGSTRKELKTELCSACHPFYTGKQKLVDTAGRVDKFLEKVKKMQAIKAEKLKVINVEHEVSEAKLRKKVVKGKKIPAVSSKKAKKLAGKSVATKKPAADKTAAVAKKAKSAKRATKQAAATKKISKPGKK